MGFVGSLSMIRESSQVQVGGLVIYHHLWVQGRCRGELGGRPPNENFGARPKIFPPKKANPKMSLWAYVGQQFVKLAKKIRRQGGDDSLDLCFVALRHPERELGIEKIASNSCWNCEMKKNVALGMGVLLEHRGPRPTLPGAGGPPAPRRTAWRRAAGSPTGRSTA